jgi:hypothetical protein
MASWRRKVASVLKNSTTVSEQAGKMLKDERERYIVWINCRCEVI